MSSPSNVRCVVGVHAVERRLPDRHPVAALQGLFGGAVDLPGHPRLDFLETRRRVPVLLEVLLVQPDRIALPPRLEEAVGEGLARLPLVVRRVPAHAKRLGDEERRSVAATATVGGQLGRRVGIEHVVAVERRSQDAVARRPVAKVVSEVMLLETRAERNLIVLDDEDDWQLFYGGEIWVF